MEDLSQLKEDLEQKITRGRQREVDLKLMKSVWGVHVRTPEDDDLSEECVCEHPRACLCCPRPPEMVEGDILYAYQGLKDITEGEQRVEDHHPASITGGQANPTLMRTWRTRSSYWARGCLGTNTQEDHLILLGELFAVCQENHIRLKLEKCEFMQETMQYLGIGNGYSWWTPAASKTKPLMDGKVRHEDLKKGLHDVRKFIGACNFYRRHIKNFTYTSAILTDLIKKSATWCWGQQEHQAFDELKDKVANAKCLGVPRTRSEIILVTDASNVGGGGTLFQWQALEKEEFGSAISQWGIAGLHRDGTLKHSYPDDKWVLVPLGHWNWKWNQARETYSTYEQELLPGMLVLSSQARLLGSNCVVWLCDQEPVCTFQKGRPPDKAKLRHLWTYLSQLRLTVHHI